MTRETKEIKGAEDHVRRMRGENTKVKFGEFEFTFRKSTQETKAQAVKAAEKLETTRGERKRNRE